MIKITKEVRDAMVAHAKKEAPIEACGYLGGKDGVVNEIYEMVNVDKSTDHFSFGPEEQFKVLKDARKHGLSLLACYHSHPASPARLSEEDIRLSNDPNMVYVILSLSDNDVDVKAFKVRKQGVDDIDIETLDIQVV
jgi:proteasome lid subunit RPN8/RPN11